jgi:hypothetical protein
MGYTLAPDIAMCIADDALVFLDIRRDRYFRLGPDLDKAIVDQIDGPAAACPWLDRAIELGALAWSNGPEARIVPTRVVVPPISAIDEIGAVKTSLLDCWSVTRATRAAARRLRAMPFAAAIKAPELTGQARTGAAPDLARVFNEARRRLPFSALCLRDSIALRAWLARRGYYSMLVIGVIAAPFSAHCWLQTQDCVLDEASDEVSRYTPIWSVA